MSLELNSKRYQLHSYNTPKGGIIMSRLRLKGIYWKLIHFALEDMMEKLKKELENLKQKALKDPYVEPYLKECFQYGALNYGKLASCIGETKRNAYKDSNLYVPKQREIVEMCDFLLSSYCQKHTDLYDTLERYKAIDELVYDASEKQDGLLEKGIGPDAPVDVDDTPEEEEFLRFLNQID